MVDVVNVAVEVVALIAEMVVSSIAFNSAMLLVVLVLPADA